MRKNRKILPYKQKPDFFIKLGAKYINRGDIKSSLKYVKKAVEMQPYNPYYQYNLACILAEMREFDESNRIFTEILKTLEPDFSDCYFEMGCNYFETGEFDEARKCFEKYIDLDPDGEYIEEVENALYYMDLYDKT